MPTQLKIQVLLHLGWGGTQETCCKVQVFSIPNTMAQHSLVTQSTLEQGI